MTTLNTPPILTNAEQYLTDLRETRKYPLSKEEQATLEEQARQGDPNAREALIIDCMQFVSFNAARLTHAYLNYHKDYLDVVQTGNLTLVERIDETLHSGKPIAYLCGIAKKQMAYYCLYRSRLISLPMNQALPKEKPAMESLDRLQDEPTWDEIELSLKHLRDEEQPEAFDAIYGPLQQAIESLSQREREVVVRHHGLDGGTIERLIDIKPLRGKPESKATYTYYYTALRKLRERLKRA